MALLGTHQLLRHYTAMMIPHFSYIHQAVCLYACQITMETIIQVVAVIHLQIQ
jgi:hypothetical protein